MKIKYPDGNKPGGFPVLDEDGKLDSSVLPESGGGGPLVIFNEVEQNQYDQWVPKPCEYTPKEIYDAFNSGRGIFFFFYTEESYGKALAWQGSFDHIQKSGDDYMVWVRSREGSTYIALQNDKTWFLD